MIRGENSQSPNGMTTQPREHAASFTSSQQVFLEDLTLVIDVSLMVAFAVAVHLLRKRIITVATLAHALSVAFLVFTAGHYIERHIIGGMDKVEDLVRRRGPARASGSWLFTSWFSAGLISAAAILMLLARFWNCKGEGDCIVGYAAPIHYPCKRARLRFFAPVFAATVVFVYLCITSRLNALLGGSVLHPTGGSYALAVLTSPALLSTLWLSGCASVWLFSVLIEEQASVNSSERDASGRGRSRLRESDTGAGIAASPTSSRRHGMQRHPTATRKAAVYENARGNSLMRRQNRHFVQDTLHGRTHGLVPYSSSDHHNQPLSAASSPRGVTWDCLRYNSGGASIGVGEFDTVGDGGLSSARRSGGSFRDRQAERHSTHAVAASPAGGASANRLHSESSALGVGVLNNNHHGVAIGDGNSHGSKGELFLRLFTPPLHPIRGRDAGNSDGDSGIRSMVMPSPHRQKGEGNGWTSSSSSASSSSSSSFASPWGPGGTRRSTRRGFHDHLRDSNNDNNDSWNSSDGRSSRGGDSTDSAGEGGGGFATALTASPLPFSSSPRSTFPSPQLGRSAGGAAVGNQGSTGTLEAPRLASETAPGFMPPRSRSSVFFPHSPASSHPPAPLYPSAASCHSPAAQPRPIGSRPPALASGDSTNSSSSSGGQSSGETGRSADSRRSRNSTHSSFGTEIRSVGTFPLRRRESSDGDTRGGKWTKGRRNRTASSRRDSSSSCSSSGVDEGEEELLNLESGGGGRGGAMAAAVASGGLRGPQTVVKGVPPTGVVAGGWNGGIGGGQLGYGVVDRGGLRPSPPGSLLRHRRGWGT